MQHILIALVEDKTRCVKPRGLVVPPRGFNIESLTVGHTDQPGISRMIDRHGQRQRQRRAGDFVPVQTGERHPGGRPDHCPQSAATWQ